MRLRPAQIVVIAVALGAGGLAAMLMGGRREPAPVAQPIAAPEPTIRTVDVLVAAADVPMGKVLTSADLQWRRWPEEAGSDSFVVRRAGDTGQAAMDEAIGSIARTAFVHGEPIRPAKLIKGGRGFMSAILNPGMRAIAAPIDDPSRGAGAFILPNDRVDVILARRNAGPAAQGEGMTHTSSTVLRNVRVLAIDQVVEERNGDKAIVGRTATLELTPAQAELLALARELGTLSLSLRSLADSAAATLAGEAGDDGDPLFSTRHGGRLTIVRHGQPQSVPTTGQGAE
ncbi:Flp pilus assembly protein CpaB [Phreatobacter sp. AB_2022a]|uniref:Flp pilus assembly protein CpaB n=1 Tax=Phreatobacter sp. AB_2022a TaxID=3003134 RepID=UPI0022876263|nr:Flp pilus assembly protein CpaB [Phreatobacter sp. AB_2022a]MCZ0736039.1 Flp pilus assembly protein CpaB [Phreatobacter sp. AB_2022a]